MNSGVDPVVVLLLFDFCGKSVYVTWNPRTWDKYCNSSLGSNTLVLYSSSNVCLPLPLANPFDSLSFDELSGTWNRNEITFIFEAFSYVFCKHQNDQEISNFQLYCYFFIMEKFEERNKKEKEKWLLWISMVFCNFPQNLRHLGLIKFMTFFAHFCFLRTYIKTYC